MRLATFTDPIIPRKFFHTSGNFREHEDESRRVEWSHEIAPWIVFFQNLNSMIGPDEPISYPDHLTSSMKGPRRRRLQPRRGRGRAARSQRVRLTLSG